MTHVSGRKALSEMEFIAFDGAPPAKALPTSRVFEIISDAPWTWQFPEREREINSG
jgi:hypothetical protein